MIHLTAGTHEERMCANKKVYLTRDEAARQAKSLRKRGGDRDRAVRQYRCPYCGLWHVGHDPSITLTGERRR